MTGLSFEDQTMWRTNVKNAILYGDYDYDYKPIFVDPTTRYNFEEKTHKTEREVFEYDLNAVRKSDLVVVNFNRPGSLGTAVELAVAMEHRIPVVGLNCGDHDDIHPWLECCCMRMCDNMKELVDYIVEYFLK